MGAFVRVSGFVACSGVKTYLGFQVCPGRGEVDGCMVSIQNMDNDAWDRLDFCRSTYPDACNETADEVLLTISMARIVIASKHRRNYQVTLIQPIVRSAARIAVQAGSLDNLPSLLEVNGIFAIIEPCRTVATALSAGIANCR